MKFRQMTEGMKSAALKAKGSRLSLEGKDR